MDKGNKICNWDNKSRVISFAVTGVDYEWFGRCIDRNYYGCNICDLCLNKSCKDRKNE